MRFSRGILLPVLLAIGSTSAKEAKTPKYDIQPFKTQPSNLFYFDDSEVVITTEPSHGRIWRSEDAGKTWVQLKEIPENEVLGVLKNPFDNNVAIALGAEFTHWITYDKGASWTEFTTAGTIARGSSPLSFHAWDSKKIIFNGADDCSDYPCIGKSWYTEDGFATKPKLLRDERKMCIWAKSTERFLATDDGKHDDRVLCIVKGKYSRLAKDFRMVISDNFFNDEEEPVMASGRTVSGMANMAAVKGYIVAAAKSQGSDELALYVTDDTNTWHRAEFGDHKVEEDAYTILESTNYSVQVDVMTSKYAAIGALFTSNSNGTYFTKNIEHTNRDREGYVDFEKISNIQGIVLVNVVDNWKEVETTWTPKKVKSQISFDDGRTFEPLKVGDKELHLHSVTDLRNSGRVFSSPAPGLVMGVGNTGKYLKAYEEGDLYVSDDAGLTWQLALQEAHKYEFGDQGSVLVAIYDEGETDEIRYSLKHGRPDTWETLKLDFKFRAYELTTIPDSTSLKFIATGARRASDGAVEHIIISLDFSDLPEGKCKDSDFNDWNSRVDEKGNAICIMGQQQIFRRRKWDADCFVDEEFKDPVPSFKTCECTDKDFECDFNFVPEWDGEEKKCVPAGTLSAPEGECTGDKKTFKGSSGWRLIPGNKCEGGVKKGDLVERPCSDTTAPPASGKITHEYTSFKGKNFREYYYLERTEKSVGSDETIVMLTSEREAYITHDHGKTWEIAVEDEIVAIYPHQYYNDFVYFITPSKKVYYSEDRGLHNSINSFEAPFTPNTQMLQILSFHPNEKHWLIWIGAEDCLPGSDGCHSTASVSTKNGLKWDPMLTYVKKCQFMWREEGRQVNEKLVFCEQYTKEEPGQPLQLISSEDWFEHQDVRFTDVVEFATMSEFIIVASKTEDRKSLKVDASLDGKTFADAKFPPKFNVDHQKAYTVLDSSTHSIFLHVTVNPMREQEYGTIIKSNSNGTSYVLSINEVNRNTAGYVDFEKMQGIEGVILVNVIANREAVDGGAKKQKKTKITHNDGADWDWLTPPNTDVDGKKYACSGDSLDKCSLHLHGYTERSDPRETFSSPTAVGLMMGVGNVGEFLGPYNDGDTFLTNDGGITWMEIMKGTYMWEYGDQGSVIVIVRKGEDTNHVYYSRDNGKTWDQYQFSDHAMRIDAITTVPSDTSLNFLLWGKDGSRIVTINLDFSGLFVRQCVLDEKNPEAGDYELWKPQHPKQETNCLFGHVAEYHRKKEGLIDCYNGRKIDHLHNIARNCSCTRRDFECDYNFERQTDGSCKAIRGLELPDPMQVCRDDPSLEQYWDVTGYRKIPISTCEGGLEMQHTSKSHPCPNHEKEYKEKHGISAFGLFIAIVIPIVAAAGIGYYVWRNWDGKFGRIRLGESGGSFDSDSAWIKWPVILISGLVAVVAAIPLLLGSLWRTVSSRVGGGYGGRTYTSRSSFARGRGDYAVVDPDEGELLGEESDEEV
ncbi:vacuolar protein sorting/targeting protein 10 [Lepidopterella palustris CBS 459.81]|uniref:Vacuolar protein sorting/targeting protein 10 n=1 Tax=Lepidopterella palustris CBS 459.81 TaxID=1314670 RepID=A0A8E2JCQ3_9PEZI|nr:vacuolar protein sorting/targeting protein 10 [Lepidopterella palustris CBS 459.81]